MSNKESSNLQESTVAKYLGWKVVSGSGARPFHVGDVVSEDWLGECKTHNTSRNAITFNLNVLKKISDEAMSKHRFPVLIVDDGSQQVDNTWCCVSILPWVSVTSTLASSAVKINALSITIPYVKMLSLDRTEIYTVITSKGPLYIMSITKFKDLIEEG